MSKWLKEGKCPNAHGPLVIPKHPIAILYLLSEDLCSVAELEGAETPEGMFGYVIGFCPECGFVATTAPSHEYNYETCEWRLRTSEKKEDVE